MTHIHSTALIGESVQIGERVEVGPYAVIEGPCEIHDDVFIGAHCVIGADPQARGVYPYPLDASRSAHELVIRQGACLREHVVAHRGVVGPTIIGRDALIMLGAHVGHDCIIGDETTLGSVSLLGGFTMIAERVTFGQGVVTHPWVCVGEAAMVGLNSSVLRDVEPFEKIAGAHRVLGLNEHRIDDAYDRSLIGGSAKAAMRWSNLTRYRDQVRAFWDARG